MPDDSIVTQMIAPQSEQRIVFNDRIMLAGIMMLSLAIKLFVFGFDHVINPDGVLYIAAAQKIASGNVIAALKLYPMFAYPMLLASIQWLVPDWITAARIVNIAAMVIATIPLFGITRILFNRNAAFWATLCFALTPEANEQIPSVLRDPVFLLLALATVHFFLKGLASKSIQFIFGALILAGSSFLFRVEGVVLLMAPIFYLSLKGMMTKDAPEKRFLRQSLALWIGFPLVLLVLLTTLFSSQLLTQNRLWQFTDEIHRIRTFTAFENYQEIYRFFKTIEDQPPFSPYSKSLPAIVRHWMPLIYLIGVLEYFVKQVFIVFIIPLIIVVRRYFSRQNKTIAAEKSFILLIWVIYMALILYAYMVRDFIQGRFLFTPAILLYPWVGHGLTLIWEWLGSIRFARAMQIALALLVIAPAGVKSLQAVTQNDSDQLEVVQFIKSDAKLATAKILFSDPRHWLYCQSSDPYLPMSQAAGAVSTYLANGQIGAIEKRAMRYQADAIVLAVNLNKTATIPELKRYDLYHKLPARKGATVIYTFKTADEQH